MNGDFDLAWQLFQYLVIIGFSIAIVFAVVFGVTKFAINNAVYVVIIAALIWYFGG